jgi:adenylate cyclase
MLALARTGVATLTVLISVMAALVQLYGPAERAFVWRGSYFETVTSVLAPFVQKSARIPVQLVAIDDETISRSGKAWPWPETALQELTYQLQSARPRLLLIDLGRPARAREAVNSWDGIGLDHKLDAPARLIQSAWSAPQERGTWPLIVLRDGALHPSFELAAAMALTGTDRVHIVARAANPLSPQEPQAIRGITPGSGAQFWATSGDGALRLLPVRAPTGFSSSPAWRVTAGDPEVLRSLEDSVVIVRVTNRNTQDAGVLGTQALAQLVNGLTPSRPNWASLAETALATLAAAAIAMLMVLRRRTHAVMVAALALVAALGASLAAFVFNLTLIDAVTPSIFLVSALLLGAAGGEARRALAAVGARNATNALRIVGKRIRGSERREVSVLVCKIRELETVAESFREQSEALAHVVSTLLTTAAGIARAHSGAVEHMSASRLVVLFNAPLEDARHVEHATEASLAMLGRLDPLNQDFEKLFTPGTFAPFNFSIGIETGDALVGELGLKEKGELSAIGPVVDTASLLAERARTYGPAILVGAATQSRITRGFALLQLDLAVVNGGEPKPFYALMGNPVLRANPRFKALQEGFDAFHGAYRRGKWGQASALLRQCAKLPGANPRFVALYERRLAFLKEHGTEPGWNGVLRLPIE